VTSDEPDANARAVLALEHRRPAIRDYLDEVNRETWRRMMEHSSQTGATARLHHLFGEPTRVAANRGKAP
jgi:hypothetical protein